MVWTGRYPWIVESALKNRHRQFVIDGEAVILGVDGIADFNALHSRQHDDEGAALRLDVCRRHLNKINDLRIGFRIDAPSRKGSAGFFKQPQR